MFLRFWLLSILSFGFVVGQTTRDCPENFSLTSQTEVCVPDEFVFLQTTVMGSYVFHDV